MYLFNNSAQRGGLGISETIVFIYPLSRKNKKNSRTYPNVSYFVLYWQTKEYILFFIFIADRKHKMGKEIVNQEC